MGLPEGIVQLYTGDGKGKTTATLGLALRAAGHGLRTCFVQFMKRGWESGEQSALARLAPEIELHIFGSERWGDPTAAPEGASWWELPPSKEDRDQAQEALAFGRSVMVSGDWDIVVLDEVLGALSYGLISAEQLLELICARPTKVELVLTGRNAPLGILAAADLVTEMKAVKHPFQRGMKARMGIEF
jgi:cob(I)alamin adenosyltransferase